VERLRLELGAARDAAAAAQQEGAAKLAALAEQLRQAREQVDVAAAQLEEARQAGAAAVAAAQQEGAAALADLGAQLQQAREQADAAAAQMAAAQQSAAQLAAQQAAAQQAADAAAAQLDEARQARAAAVAAAEEQKAALEGRLAALEKKLAEAGGGPGGVPVPGDLGEGEGVAGVPVLVEMYVDALSARGVKVRAPARTARPRPGGAPRGGAALSPAALWAALAKASRARACPLLVSARSLALRPRPAGPLALAIRAPALNLSATTPPRARARARASGPPPGRGGAGRGEGAAAGDGLRCRVPWRRGRGAAAGRAVCPGEALGAPRRAAYHRTRHDGNDCEARPRAPHRSPAPARVRARAQPSWLPETTDPSLLPGAPHPPRQVQTAAIKANRQGLGLDLGLRYVMERLKVLTGPPGPAA
jgi:hypothetical protein